MKILIIGPFPDPVFGVSLSNLVLTKGLLKKGHKIKTIDTATTATIDSVQGAWSIRKLKFLKNYLKLYKVLNADVVYCTIGQTFFGILKYAPFVFFAKFLNKQLIVHVKGGYLKTSYEMMSPLKQKISKRILQYFDKGIVLSKSLKPLLQKFLADEKIFIRHNFIQNSLILPAEKVQKLKEFKQLRLVFMSNLIAEKGIEELLAALEFLNSKNIAFEAKIAGNVPSDQGQLCDKMASIKNTHYLGVVRGVKKAKLLSWANVFCLPTYYAMEGQPISILEAMGFGNLIITTKHAGIPDVCSEKNSVFVEVKSAKSLSDRLLTLSKSLDRLEKSSPIILEEARGKYSEDAFVDGIINIINTKITQQKSV